MKHSDLHNTPGCNITQPHAVQGYARVCHRLKSCSDWSATLFRPTKKRIGDNDFSHIDTTHDLGKCTEVIQIRMGDE